MREAACPDSVRGVLSNGVFTRLIESLSSVRVWADWILNKLDPLFELLYQVNI